MGAVLSYCCVGRVENYMSKLPAAIRKRVLRKGDSYENICILLQAVIFSERFTRRILQHFARKVVLNRIARRAEDACFFAQEGFLDRYFFILAAEFIGVDFVFQDL